MTQPMNPAPTTQIRPPPPAASRTVYPVDSWHPPRLANRRHLTVRLLSKRDQIGGTGEGMKASRLFGRQTLRL